jgi:putative ABC transport system ATP-binding protein
MADPLITLRGLHKSFTTPAGTANVLRGVDLDVHKGDFVAVLGPSGVGKTTLLNMMTGVDKPTSGHVLADGIDLVNTSERKLTRWRGRNVGIVFQFFQLLPTLTVLENIMVPMDLCAVHPPTERQERALALLDNFDVADHAHKTPDLLSGGQQQRVAIARALANEPPIIIGDEPTGNLDRMSAAVVFDTFYELQDAGHTIVIVTHDRELVQGVPRVLHIRNGQLYDRQETTRETQLTPVVK